MVPKCIIFDCDGVLVDSETIGNQVLIDMARTHGFDMKIEQALKNFNGRALQSTLQHIEDAIQKKLPENFEKDFRENSFEAFKTQLQPIKGVKEFIAYLEIPFCVASSGPVAKIRLNLTTTGLIDKFEGKIFSSYDIESWKPDPEIFLHAAKQMGFEVSDCVVIEDSIAGVTAAKNGGFKVYAIANQENEQELAALGAILFSSYGELRKKLIS